MSSGTFHRASVCGSSCRRGGRSWPRFVGQKAAIYARVREGLLECCARYRTGWQGTRPHKVYANERRARSTGREGDTACSQEIDHRLRQGIYERCGERIDAYTLGLSQRIPHQGHKSQTHKVASFLVCYILHFCITVRRRQITLGRLPWKRLACCIVAVTAISAIPHRSLTIIRLV